MCLAWFWLSSTEVERRNPDAPEPFTYNAEYPRSIYAILKVVQGVFTLVAFFCAVCAPYWTERSYHGFRFFVFVCQWFFWTLVIFYLINVLNIQYRCRWKWINVELICYIFATFFFAIASIIAAALAANPAMIAAAIFGFFCVVLYGIGLWLFALEWRAAKKHSSTGGIPIHSTMI